MVRAVAGEWSDPERVTEYLAREIPHRDIAEGMLLEALPERVGRVLDIGTGDGRLLALVHGCGTRASRKSTAVSSGWSWR
jgi:hypothetical protein